MISAHHFLALPSLFLHIPREQLQLANNHHTKSKNSISKKDTLILFCLALERRKESPWGLSVLLFLIGRATTTGVIFLPDPFSSFACLLLHAICNADRNVLTAYWRAFGTKGTTRTTKVFCRLYRREWGNPLMAHLGFVPFFFFSHLFFAVLSKNPSVLFVLYLWCGLFFAISFSFFLRFTKLLHLDTPLFYLSPYINRYLQILLSLSIFALSSDDEVTFEQFQLLHMPKSKAVSSDERDVSHHTTVTHIF
jgi:hypothetical protein